MSKERMGLFKRFRNVIFDREDSGKAADDSPTTSEENPQEADEAALEPEGANNKEDIVENSRGEDNAEEPSADDPSAERSGNMDEDSAEEMAESEEEMPSDENSETKDFANDDPIEVQFALKFGELGGRFVYCESLDELKASLGSLMEDKEWHRVFLWEDEVKTLVSNNKYQRNPLGFNMEKSDVAISFCESLIAEDGSILFSPYQASQRGLQVFPDHQIVLAKPADVAQSISNALAGFQEKYRDQLPSRLSLEPEAKNLTVEGTLVLNCGGTKDVYVFLCEEL